MKDMALKSTIMKCNPQIILTRYSCAKLCLLVEMRVRVFSQP